MTRIAIENITPEKFDQEFVTKNRPVIVTGVSKGWPATTLWTEERLVWICIKSLGDTSSLFF